MIQTIIGVCDFEGCADKATHVACGRSHYVNCKPVEGHPKPSCYCEHHAEVVAEENNPEYQVECPNCKCLFGVG